MVWVEQPVGVGFTQGTPDIYGERELATQFMGFFKNFVETFTMQGYKVYITGESYAGFYVPYVANAFLEAEDDRYYNLKGVAINDPFFGDNSVQVEAIIIPYLNYWSNLLDLNSTFINRITKAAEACGYPAYLEKYFTFPPPKESFPVLPDPYRTPGCDIQDSAFAAAIEANPCLNVYHITETCPFKYNVLGRVDPGDYEPPGAMIYFNRTDVQKAINAPVGTDWMQCTRINVFGGPNDDPSIGDRSIGPAQNGVLANGIEKTNNTIIGSGDLDFLLPTNGTLFALQNVTWNGMQGFQAFACETFYVPYHPEYNEGALAGAGNVGQWGTERGLTFYSVRLSGHELPGYAPGAGYRVLEKLLGKIPDLSTKGDFTTQMGDFTGSGTIY